MLRSLLIAATLVALLSPSTGWADAAHRMGPLPARTRNPLYLLHLQPGPRRAQVLAPAVVSLDAQVDWANIFDVWGRTVSEGRQLSDLDMEIVRTGLSLRIGVLPRFEVGIEVPTLTLGPGVTDGFIEAWHAAIKADNGGREEVRSSTFGYRVQIPDVIRYSPEPVTLGLGDIVLDATAQLLRADKLIPDLAASLYFKLPTGSYERGTGSGVPDVSFVVYVEHGVRALTGYAHAGVIILGRDGDLANLLRPASFTFGMGFELALSHGLSFVAQLQGSSSFNHGFVHKYSSLSPMGLTLGGRFRVGEMVFGLGMEQDVLNGDPSADLTIVFDARFTIGGERQGSGVGRAGRWGPRSGAAPSTAATDLNRRP